jgi:hypothetical protein
MIEIHCWITLRYDDYHSDDQAQQAFVAKFKDYLNQEHPDVLSTRYGHLISYNGLECFSLHTQHNHRGTSFYPLQILTWVAQNGKGSYGLLYYYDDEDGEVENAFQVHSLKRGKVAKQQDRFLSPYIPEVVGWSCLGLQCTCKFKVILVFKY